MMRKYVYIYIYVYIYVFISIDMHIYIYIQYFKLYIITEMPYTSKASHNALMPNCNETDNKRMAGMRTKW